MMSKSTFRYMFYEQIICEITLNVKLIDLLSSVD